MDDVAAIHRFASMSLDASGCLGLQPAGGAVPGAYTADGVDAGLKPGCPPRPGAKG